MGESAIDFQGLLQTELSGISKYFQCDELAFLALTSKVEAPIRDRLAYALFRAHPDLRVTREWRRVDLAVLSSEVAPLMLLEAKAFYTFDMVGKDDAWIQRYPELVKRDIQKLQAIQAPPTTQMFALALATHPKGRIDIALKEVCKYVPGINKAVELLGDSAVQEAAAENLKRSLAPLGEWHPGQIEGGKAYGVPIVVDYWLIGPISPSRLTPIEEPVA